MDNNDIDEFGRCVAEFGESVAAFGAIQSIMVQVEGMKVENVRRQDQGYTMAYDDSAFAEMSDEIDKIVDKVK